MVHELVHCWFDPFFPTNPTRNKARVRLVENAVDAIATALVQRSMNAAKLVTYGAILLCLLAGYGWLKAYLSGPDESLDHLSLQAEARGGDGTSTARRFCTVVKEVKGGSEGPTEAQKGKSWRAGLATSWAWGRSCSAVESSQGSYGGYHHGDSETLTGTPTVVTVPDATIL